MSEVTIAFWTLVITAIGVVVGLATLFAGWLTLRDSAKTGKAAFWIMLRNLFAWYDDIHVNFRPGGKWDRSEAAPESVSEMARIELYMGVFEYCDVLLEGKLLDEQTFKDSYAYRLSNLLTNKWVVDEKLIARRESWLAFINLCYRLEVPGIEVPPLTASEHSKRYPKK
jgi:hypothetical protein